VGRVKKMKKIATFKHTRKRDQVWTEDGKGCMETSTESKEVPKKRDHAESQNQKRKLRRGKQGVEKGALYEGK